MAKIDQSFLWLEKKLFRYSRRKTYCLLLLCLIAGGGAIWLDLLKGEQALALNWIVVTMFSGTKTAVLCIDHTTKHLIALKGSMKQIVVHRMILPICRIEAFVLLFSLVAYAMLEVKQISDICFLLRIVICIIETPIMVFFIVMIYLLLRGFIRTFINVLTIAVLNMLFIAEEWYALAYLAEALFVFALFLTAKSLIGKLTGESLLIQGV